jgi:hypothetical protein
VEASTAGSDKFALLGRLAAQQDPKNLSIPQLFEAWLLRRGLLVDISKNSGEETMGI